MFLVFTCFYLILYFNFLGVPPEHKARMWGICSGAYCEMRLNPGEYRALVRKSRRSQAFAEFTMEEIERDLHRWVR